MRKSSSTRHDGRSYVDLLDVASHQPAVGVKGVTDTALDVGQETSGRWVTRCVVDV
jgi:hypothetical protein